MKHNMSSSQATPLPKLSWNNQTVTIRTLVRALADKEYDIDPTHQRKVVHTQDWKEELITSIFEVGCIPETWWHPVQDADGLVYNESVDGKQRTSTISDFYLDKITWRGKKFSQLDRSAQNEFLGHQLSLRIANRTLTPSEIARIFEKLQRVKQTTLGEVLHSQRYPLTEQLEGLIQQHGPLLKKMKIDDKRHQQLEGYGKSLDYWIRNSESDLPLSRAVCETDTVTETWSNHQQGLSLELLAQYEVLMRDTWEAFTVPNLADVPRKMQAGQWLPVFALLSETRAEDVAALKLYLNGNLANIVQDEATWPKVGGNHNALVTRKDKLKQLFSERPTI